MTPQKSCCMFFCLCLVLLGVSALTYAGDAGGLSHGSSFDVEVQTFYFDYEEDGVNMEEEGFMYGMVGSYVFQGQDGLYFASTLEIDYGELDYDGETWGGTPVSADTEDWIIQWRCLLGLTVYDDRALSVIPFAGIGYRYWYDDIKASGGYEREIHYWYVPLGVKLAGALPYGWQVAVSAEYDFFLGGRVKSYLSDANFAFNDPEVDQDFASGYGLRASMGFQKRITDGLDLLIEPFLRYWDIDKSDYATLTYYGTYYATVYEPANTTMSYGIRVGLRF